MKISRNSFDEAVKQQIITEQQAIDLWAFLKSQPETSSRFTNILLCFRENDCDSLFLNLTGFQNLSGLLFIVLFMCQDNHILA